MAESTHYEILGITPSFPADAIEGLRASLDPIHEPDSASAPDAERMRRLINEACDVLGDPVRRSAYNATLANSSQRATADTTSSAGGAPTAQEASITGQSQRSDMATRATSASPPLSTHPSPATPPDLARSALRAAQTFIAALNSAGTVAAIVVAGFLWTAFWSGLFTSWQNPIIYIGLIVGFVYVAKEYDKEH
jgi:curved DNA-binding protein CbpA